MSIKLTVHLPKCVVEIEGNKQTELFKEFARSYEVFGETQCGKCGSEHIVPVAREASDGKKTYDYYEWVCKKCGSKLALGQQEGGVLFPKRRLMPNGAPCKPGEKGEYVNNGWTKYRGDKTEDLAEPEPNTRKK